MMQSFREYAEQFAALLCAARELPPDAGGGADRPAPAAADAPVALLLAPQPGAESLNGALALRLQREAGWAVTAVAVTLGAPPDGRESRWRNMHAACRRLGFGLDTLHPRGLERITFATRRDDPLHWVTAVAALADLLRAAQPHVLFFPHAGDAHELHSGTHFLAMDALRSLHDRFACHLVETEYWAPLDAPNLAVETGAADAGDLVAAAARHAGDPLPRPQHATLPAWLADNARRAAELVRPRDGAAPDALLATLYRVRRWAGGRLHPAYDGGRWLRCGERADAFLA